MPELREHCAPTCQSHKPECERHVCAQCLLPHVWSNLGTARNHRIRTDGGSTRCLLVEHDTAPLREKSNDSNEMKWKSVLGGVLAAAALLVGIPTLLRHTTGAKGSEISPAFDRMKACALKYAPGDTGLQHETLAHAVNGTVRVISDDSLHRLLPGQPVAALTRWIVDSTHRDTSLTIYTSQPVDIAMIEHEFANALSIRHRRALTGSDTGHIQLSPFYKACVTYCPQCGAY